MDVRKHRAIFVSDVHMGMRASHADKLLDFFHHNTAPTIYLVGDIFDFWALGRQERHWPPVYTELIRHFRILDSQGVKIYYLVGNHDQFLESMKGDYGNFEIADTVVHRTAENKKFLVLHGHQVDYVSKHLHWVETIGDWAYDWAIVINHKVAKVRAKMGLPYWSFSQWTKRSVKGVLSYVEGFREALKEAAVEQGCEGVICGHIHTADISVTDGFTYINTGDWIESLTAIVEEQDGHFELITWDHTVI